MLLYAYTVLPFTDFKLLSIFTLSSDCVVRHSMDCILIPVICISLLSCRKLAHVFYIYRTRHEWRSLRTIECHRSSCLPRLQPPLRKVSQQKATLELIERRSITYRVQRYSCNRADVCPLARFKPHKEAHILRHASNVAKHVLAIDGDSNHANHCRLKQVNRIGTLPRPTEHLTKRRMRGDASTIEDDKDGHDRREPAVARIAPASRT